MEFLSILLHVIVFLVIHLLENDEFLALIANLVAVAESNVKVLILHALFGTLHHLCLTEVVNVTELVGLHLSGKAKPFLLRLNNQIPRLLPSLWMISLCIVDLILLSIVDNRELMSQFLVLFSIKNSNLN